MSDDKLVPENFSDLVHRHRRKHQGTWTWYDDKSAKRDRSVQDKANAETVLESLGLSADWVQAQSEDPPDCVALVHEQIWGIELTELVDDDAFRRVREGEKVYRVWKKEDLIDALQKLLAQKDEKEWKGGPYDRIALLILTDEYDLAQHNTSEFLTGAVFRAQQITDAFLTLGYHPDVDGNSCYPSFRLAISNPSQSR